MTRVDFFSAEQAGQRTGLSQHQLAAWDRAGVHHPQWGGNGHGDPKLYSFRDLVVLRPLAILREEHGVSSIELRRVAVWLDEHRASPWTDLRLWVAGRRVHLGDQGARTSANGRLSGQLQSTIELAVMADQMRARVEARQRRQPEEIGHIVRRPGVQGNAPVLAGTRIPTSAVWNFHEAGYNADQIIDEYPRLTPEDVEAAIIFEQQRRVG
jgi:uncharacterized protein (DUF433 family)